MTVELQRIATELRDGRQSPRVSVREFLSWFGAQRRGYWIVYSIRRELEELGVETDPDFETTYIDAPIAFQLAKGVETEEPVAAADEVESEAEAGIADGVAKDSALLLAMEDPTYRISKLGAANQSVVRIAPNGSLAEAVTLLMANDFSQLPVMTTDRDVKGVVTWKSVGQRLALSATTPSEAREVMVPHKEISSEASIFEAIPTIISHDYVLVRSPDNKVAGIITASDLSQQFLMTAEPFLLLGEIENLLRHIIEFKFSLDDLQGGQRSRRRRKRDWGRFGSDVRRVHQTSGQRCEMGEVGVASRPKDVLSDLGPGPINSQRCHAFRPGRNTRART